MNKSGYKLVDSDGNEIAIGSVVQLHGDGEAVEVIDFDPPKTCASTGRVYVQYNPDGPIIDYYPSVIRAKIIHESGYKVVNGRICDPGKFENQPVYVPHFWDLILEGDNDYEIYDDNDVHYAFIKIDPPDAEKWPELKHNMEHDDYLMLWESDQGFVYCDIINQESFYEMKETGITTVTNTCLECGEQDGHAADCSLAVKKIDPKPTLQEMSHTLTTIANELNTIAFELSQKEGQ